MILFSTNKSVQHALSLDIVAMMHRCTERDLYTHTCLFLLLIWSYSWLKKLDHFKNDVIKQPNFTYAGLIDSKLHLLSWHILEVLWSPWKAYFKAKFMNVLTSDDIMCLLQSKNNLNWKGRGDHLGDEG